jgi:hypothetical protein
MEDRRYYSDDRNEAWKRGDESKSNKRFECKVASSFFFPAGLDMSRCCNEVPSPKAVKATVKKKRRCYTEFAVIYGQSSCHDTSHHESPFNLTAH